MRHIYLVMIILGIICFNTPRVSASGVRKEVKNGANPKIWKPGINPQSGKPRSRVSTIFRVQVAGEPAPSAVLIEEVTKDGQTMHVLGPVHDDGKDPDDVLGDRIFSGQFPLINGPQELVRYFRSIAHYKGGRSSIVSEAVRFHVTSFPVDLLPLKNCTTIKDSINGVSVCAGFIVVQFSENTTSNRIRKIMHEIGGEVVGSILSLDTYLVRLTSHPVKNHKRDAKVELGVIKNTIRRLSKYSEVMAANPYVMENGQF